MILTGTDIRNLLSQWDYDPEAIETYSRAADSAARHEETAYLLESVRTDYESGASIEIRDVLSRMDALAPLCGESLYTMRMLPYFYMLDGARSRYKDAGISCEIYHDSFADLLWKTRECHRIYGVWGSFVAPWFYRFFELKCFALGRLQFEFASFAADEPLVRGSRVINVHIPSSGALIREEYEESYARAVEFFGYGNNEAAPFVCDSWLLHPLCAQLDSGSGIRRFASDYELLYVIDDPNYTDMWIVFGEPWRGSAVNLPENTKLQHIFRRHLLSGGKVGRGYGLYLREV